MALGRRRFIRASAAGANADSLSSAEGLERLQTFFEETDCSLVMSAKRVAILMLPVALAACIGNDDSRPISFMGSGGAAANQPFPNNFRAEELAFMRTYLNNPVGLHDASMAEPVLRDVNGRTRYVSCLRYAVRESDGSYREPRERAILFVNGRLDRMIDKPDELCAGAAYAPFPDLE